MLQKLLLKGLFKKHQQKYNLIGNKIADKITSVAKTQSKNQKIKDKKSTNHQKKGSRLLMP